MEPRSPYPGPHFLPQGEQKPLHLPYSMHPPQQTAQEQQEPNTPAGTIPSDIPSLDTETQFVHSPIYEQKDISTTITSHTPIPKILQSQLLKLPTLPPPSTNAAQEQQLGLQLEVLLKSSLEKIDTLKTPHISRLSYQPPPSVPAPAKSSVSSRPSQPSSFLQPPPPSARPIAPGMKRGTVLLLMGIACVLLFRAFGAGSAQLLGNQGWAYVLGGPTNRTDPNLLAKVKQQLPQAGGKQETKVTPQQYVDLIMSKMSLEQKLGQMMLVQFLDSQYSVPLQTMITQYNVGGVLIFKSNRNIQNASQLKSLTQQMQLNSKPIPLTIAIDQEGGAVDRLVDLDGARPSAASIGATNDPAKARAAGMRDAQDLQTYGMNLNLAPVVDVTQVYNEQLDSRTYGNDPALVTRMASAYLEGLQQSGKVLGTLKHFPGLGNVSIDPHVGVPVLSSSKSQLEKLDWAPYRALISQGRAHVVMVTHEIVQSLDPTQPSTLSNKVVTGILRNELGFQGVIMTDSISMNGITSYVSEAQAATEAILAGADIVMGASSPEQLTDMFKNIKQALDNGTLSAARIDESVRRILLLKYSLGLLTTATK